MIFLFIVSIFAFSDSVIYDYGIIFDAGSSHTEVYVYKWDQRITQYNKTTKKLEFPKSNPMAMEEHRKTHAVTSCLGNSTLNICVADLLEPLVDFAEDLIKTEQDRWKQFPVYFKATAGVRGLERSERESLMKSVRSFFSSDAVNFHYQDENIVILSGEEEGYFGWLSVNYWYGRLHTRPTFGACDMGGASLQITWEVEPSFDVLEGMSLIRLWGVTHRVFTHSLQGYGANKALESVSRIVGHGGNHPCFLKYDKNFTVNVDSVDYSYIGSGDLVSCVDSVKAFLNHDYFCKNSVFGEDCTTTGIYFPKNQLPGVQFYFFSSFGFLQSDLASLGFNQHTTLNELLVLQEKIFEMNYTEFLTAVGGDVPEDLLRNVPFNMVYAIQVLLEFGFDPDVPQTWQQETAEGNELNWATGSMILDVDILEPEFIVDDDSDGGGLTREGKRWQITAIFGISMSVILIILIYVCRKRPGHGAELREPLVQTESGT